MRVMIGCLAILSLAVPATASVSVEMHDDGSVVVEGQRYATIEEFQMSEQFRTGGHRCATKTPAQVDISPLLGAAGGADCSFTSTTIRPQYEFDVKGGTIYRVPVVFHIVRRDNGFGDVSEALVLSQLDIINEDFRALTGTPGAPGVDTGFEFYLPDTDPDGFPTTGIYFYNNDDWFSDPGPQVFNSMKSALAWDTTRYLNIYSNDSAGALGYATFPQNEGGTINDGVVLLWSSVGRDAPNGGIYDQGRTGTHEIGHWLGIFHNFSGSCGMPGQPYTSGDLVGDTAPQEFPLFNCPAGSATCGSTDDIDNYMNYTQDTCMSAFTAEQTNRMRCSFENYRQEIGNLLPIFGDNFETGDLTRWTSSVSGI
ncbi:MAG: zinc metalloprotease [Acidobacteriota bacterium]